MPRFSRTSAAGLGIFNWRYSEAGDFVDTGDGSIFRASYSKSGTNFGPVHSAA